MPGPVRFSALRSFLEGLGFKAQVTPGSRITFHRDDSPALIVFRPYRDDEAVTVTDTTLVRRVLDDFGILDRSTFEESLRGLVQAS